MNIVSPADIPNSIRPSVVVVLAIFVVASAAVGAYAGVVTKAQSIAVETAAPRDAVIQKDLDDHKDRDKERFEELKSQLGAMNGKLDRLLERGR